MVTRWASSSSDWPSPGAHSTAGSGAFLWFLTSVNGTNYEDGSATVIPARKPDVIIPVRAVSTAQRVIVVAPLVPGSWYVLVSQTTGQTWAASGNTIKVTPLTYQGV